MLIVTKEDNDPERSRLRIRRSSASDQIHAALRERIVALELTPGQGLSRAEIADGYGVSQTPVRDAMLKLEQEGLLVIYPQSRTEVTRIDVAQARQTQFLRLSIELEVARTLARSGRPELLAPARHALALQRTAHDGGDVEAFRTLDGRFHHAMCAAAGVAELWALVTARSGHIDRLRNLNLPDPGKATEILRYHALILDAVAAGDVAAAEAALRGHLSGTLALVDEIRARYPDWF